MPGRWAQKPKKFGQYVCYKATTTRPSSELNFTSTNRRDREKKKEEKKKDSINVASKAPDTEAVVAKAEIEGKRGDG